jgi:hypothetical protein
MKIGGEIRLVGTVEQDGAVIDISAWTITAKARQDGVTGTVLGSFSVDLADAADGVYVLTIDTPAFPVCELYADVRLQPPAAAAMITDTLVVPLSAAVTDS